MTTAPACARTCVPYISNIATISTYTCSINPPLYTPLQVQVTKSSDSLTYNVMLIATDNSIVIDYTYTISNQPGTGVPVTGSGFTIKGHPNVNGTVAYPFGPSSNSAAGHCTTFNASTTRVTLGSPPAPIPPSKMTLWSTGDTYDINVSDVTTPGCCTSSTFGNVSVSFTPQTYQSFNTQVNGDGIPDLIPPSNCSMTCNGCKCKTTCNTCTTLITGNCGTIRVPIVNINGQTTVDGSDIGYVIFTICDEFTYYKEKPLPPEDKCAVIFIEPNQIKQTVFNRCCPFMVSVLRGKGHTALEKAQSIWSKVSTKVGVSFTTFFLNLILYSMSVYILSRLLYGNFDINYVLTKHFDKFLKDLGESRFCEFVEVYRDCTSVVFGYNKYFKFGNRAKSSCSETQ
jgi:hypothetical protein